MDVPNLISALGGEHQLAADCGLLPDAVRKWRRNGIPTDRALQLWRLAQQRSLNHVTLETIITATPLVPSAAARGRGRPRNGETPAVS